MGLFAGLFRAALLALLATGCGGMLGEPPASRPRERDDRPMDAKLCDWGSADACHAQCAGGDAPSCNTLGYMLENGELGSPEPRQASPFYERACEGGYPAGCNNLAWLHLLGKGLAKDSRRAMALFQQAFVHYERWCDGGQARGCTSAAEVYALMGGEDERVELALLTRGCKLGDARACGRVRR